MKLEEFAYIFKKEIKKYIFETKEINLNYEPTEIFTETEEGKLYFITTISITPFIKNATTIYDYNLLIKLLPQESKRVYLNKEDKKCYMVQEIIYIVLIDSFTFVGGLIPLSFIQPDNDPVFICGFSKEEEGKSLQ